VATALAEIKPLKQGTGSFLTYLASFCRWMADLPNVREEAMKVWLWDGLSSQLKEALAARETDCRRQPLPVMIAICKDVDTRNRDRALERSLERATASSSSSSSRAPASSRPTSASASAARHAAATAPPPPPRPAPAGSHPTNTNSGNYGPANMDLSSARARWEQRLALGQCFYCASPDHRLANCPVRPPPPARAAAAVLAPPSSSSSVSSSLSPALESGNGESRAA
jgi:hypothetical protein